MDNVLCVSQTCSLYLICVISARATFSSVPAIDLVVLYFSPCRYSNARSLLCLVIFISKSCSYIDMPIYLTSRLCYAYKNQSNKMREKLSFTSTTIPSNKDMEDMMSYHGPEQDVTEQNNIRATHDKRVLA